MLTWIGLARSAREETKFRNSTSCDITFFTTIDLFYACLFTLRRWSYIIEPRQFYYLLVPTNIAKVNLFSTFLMLSLVFWCTELGARLKIELFCLSVHKSHDWNVWYQDLFMELPYMCNFFSWPDNSQSRYCNWDTPYVSCLTFMAQINTSCFENWVTQFASVWSWTPPPRPVSGITVYFIQSFV